MRADKHGLACPLLLAVMLIGFASVAKGHIIIESVNVPDGQYMPGDPINVAFTLTNPGSDGQSVFLKAWASEDQSVDPGEDFDLGSASAFLSGGSTISLDIDGEIPKSIDPGMWFICVSVQHNKVGAPIEDHKCDPAAIDIGSPPPDGHPDLIAEDITTSVPRVTPGQSITVEWVAHNIGDEGTGLFGSSQQGVMLSGNDTITPNDQLLETEFLGPLGPGESTPEVHTVTIPDDLPTNDEFVYIGVCMDWFDDIAEGAEGGENNNCNADPVLLEVLRPNLSTLGVNGEDPSGPGDMFQVQFFVDNTGNAGAPATVASVLWSSDNAVGSDQSVGTCAVPALDAGESTLVTCMLQAPSDVECGENAYLVACADFGDAVNESDEQDNCDVSVSAVTVGPCPPAIVDCSVNTGGSPAAPGDAVTVTYTIDNPNSSSVSVGLGATITHQSSGQSFNDPANDICADAPPGTSMQTRQFGIPPDAPPRSYTATAAIWEVVDDSCTWGEQFDMCSTKFDVQSELPMDPPPPGEWTVIVHGATFGKQVGDGTMPNDAAFDPSGGGYDQWMMGLAKTIASLDPSSEDVWIHAMHRDTYEVFTYQPPDIPDGSIGSPEPDDHVDDQTRHHVLLFDWSATAWPLFPGDKRFNAAEDGFAYAAADALYAFLKHNRIAEKSMYFIGHSRGAVVVSEAVRRLLLDGIEPKQAIFLDGEGGNFVGLGLQDDRFDAWRHKSLADVRYDAIYSIVDEGDYGCYHSFDFGGPPGDGEPPSGPRLHEFDLGHSYRHGHCDGDGDISVPPIWNYLVNDKSVDAVQIGFNGIHYVYSESPVVNHDEPELEPMNADDWDGHANDEFLFNGDIDWDSAAGWVSHGGTIPEDIPDIDIDGSAPKDSDEEIVLGHEDAPAFTSIRHSWFWLRDEWSELTLAYDLDGPATCDDALRLTLARKTVSGIEEEDYTISNECGDGDIFLDDEFNVMVPSEFRGRLATVRIYIDPGEDGQVDLEEAKIDDIQFGVGCPEDISGDGVVNAVDLGLLLAVFGSAGAGLPEDISGDGVVNAVDLGLLLAAFNQECPV